jgi:hypothetical protein
MRKGPRPDDTKKFPAEKAWIETMSGEPTIRCVDCLACRWHPFGRTHGCIHGKSERDIIFIQE